MTTATQTRKPVKPVSGTVQLLRPIGAVNLDTGVVSINGKTYYLTRTEGGFRLTGYDARKGQPTVYDLPADLSGCDCPDAAWRPERPEGCKHRKALAALKAAGKLS